MKALKSLVLGAIGLCLASSPLFPDQPQQSSPDIVVNAFGGLDTTDSPAALKPYQSQDLQNVLLQPGLQAVYKRDGFARFQQPTNDSNASHGIFHFQQASGSNVQLWLTGSANVFSVVNDAANSIIVNSGITAGSTMQCTDNLGTAYCLTSSGDEAFSTTGTGATRVASIPQGTMITSTPLQLVVSGVSGSPSTIDFSANNNFTNFTNGPLTTDPYSEIINAPGSRITHIAYYFGKLFWWKDQSFGYIDGSASQYTVSITIVSTQIGTLDNSSAFWNPTTMEGPNSFSTGANPTTYGYTTASYGTPQFQLGGIFFRGQDGHLYQYDGYTLTRLSRIITPTINLTNSKKSNSWTQTTQNDFNNGSIVPTGYLSTSISPGDVIVSSFGTTENANTQWNNGTSTNLNIGVSSMTLNFANGNIPNYSFESGSANWTLSNGTVGGTTTGVNCTLNPRSGSSMLIDTIASQPAGNQYSVSLQTCSGTILNSTTFNEADNSCTYTPRSLSSAGLQGQSVKVLMANLTAGTTVATSDCFVNSGTDVQFFTASDFTRASLPQLRTVVFDDVANGSDTIALGSFTSQIYNTGLSSSTVQISTVVYVNNTITPTFDLQTSVSSGGPWREILTTAGTNATGYQYLKYTTTMSVVNMQNALTAIKSINIVARSSGTYYSAVNNAANLTSWSTITMDDFENGNSSFTYYARASTSIFTVGSSTPAWTFQVKNAAVAVSTGTYMQLRADFVLTAATETPTLNDFTFNWFEGSASDKVYITYFQDAIWFSVSSGVSSALNNEILYLDLINNAWLKFNFGTNGFLVENNKLYMARPTGPYIDVYGGVTTDDGASINAYWKSKDFSGNDPTVQNEFQQADFVFGESLSTATYTYSIDQVAQPSISLPLYSSKFSIIKRGFLLPVGRIGTFYNFQIGDNSSNAAWKLLMHKMHYNPLSWKPQTS